MADERADVPGSIVRRSESACRLRSADPGQIIQATIVVGRPADPGDIDAVTDFARRYGLTVLEASAAKRSVRVEGSIDKMNRAFGTDLAYFGDDDGEYLSYDGSLSVDADLAGRVIAVLGLHQQPVARPRAKN
jgi:hypothetical protein